MTAERWLQTKQIKWLIVSVIRHFFSYFSPIFFLFIVFLWFVKSTKNKVDIILFLFSFCTHLLFSFHYNYPLSSCCSFSFSYFACLLLFVQLYIRGKYWRFEYTTIHLLWFVEPIKKHKTKTTSFCFCFLSALTFFSSFTIITHFRCTVVLAFHSFFFTFIRSTLYSWEILTVWIHHLRLPLIKNFNYPYSRNRRLWSTWNWPNISFF